MTTISHNLNFTEQDPDIKGFQEVIFSVSNIELSIDFFQRVCGWTMVSRNEGVSALKKLWHLDESVEIEEALMVNTGDIEGFLRLVQFKNVTQRQIRSGTQAWDTGGIFDINIRTADMDSFYREFEDEGWNGYGEPLRYVFGEYDVSEVLLKGPDGITIAAMQRYSPPLVGFDHMKKSSRIFNSSIVTDDMEKSYDFYINKLGFEMFFQTPGNVRKPGHNVLSFPRNTNAEIEVPVDIVRPDLKNFGSIEYLQTKGLDGKDCSEHAKPPNLGILMLRFPVKNADAYAATLKERGLQLNSEVQSVTVAPYGTLKIFSVRSPEGVWLEFIELID